MKLSFLPFLMILLLLHGCASKTAPPPPAEPVPAAIPATQRPYKIKGKTYYPLPSSEGYVEKGVASWYGGKFHGRKTSNGEVYDMHEETAAHKTLPMNTMVLVENLENGRNMAVRVNDRGPFVKGRIIDLSLSAARKLGMVNQGTAKVRVTALGEARTFREGNREVARFLPHQDFQQGDFYVQIGSFTNRNNALKLQEKIKRQGNNAVISQFGRGDRRFYRVQVQAGSTLSVARNMEKEYNNNGYPDAFVIAR
ncbi:MAG: septal ring lytic transglycosylase RlpA family protein [Desulfurivibrio sp.]|nr:MAG: septal ring lytic transglycosylase RlpA family protein [Desulfurivibrio sp.]